MVICNVAASSGLFGAKTMCSNPLPPRPQKPGLVGLPAGLEVAIMADDGRILPQGEIGEVVIRGPNVTKGYEANPEANDKAFTDGWFRTGDQGMFDADGYLRITGRIKCSNDTANPAPPAARSKRNRETAGAPTTRAGRRCR